MLKRTHEQMVSALDEMCRFAIGDMVVPESALVTDLDAFSTGRESRSAHAKKIVGRWVEQCHGGTQIHYTMCDGTRHVEIALIPWSEYAEKAGEKRKQDYQSKVELEAEMYKLATELRMEIDSVLGRQRRE